MGADVSLQEREAELEKALQELEEQEEAQPGSVARALSLFKSWMAALIKGTATDDDGDEDEKDDGDERDDERSLDDLLEEYGLNDEEDEETGDEDEEDEQPVRKSLYETAVEDPGLSEIVAADQVVAGLLKSFSEAQEAQVRELRRELRQMRKALVALGEENKALRQELEELGKRPASSVQPGSYRVRDISKSAQPGAPDLPPAEEAMKLAATAMRKGAITAAERRQIELAYQAGRPELAASAIFKARQAEADSAR